MAATERFRRWWMRFGLATVAAVLALLLGWWLRQSQGALINELFALLSAPFVYGSPAPAQLADDRTQQLLAQLETLDQENQRLRDLLKVEPRLGSEAITARVIGRSADHWWQQMVLNRGSLDGVTVGSVVLSEGGAVVGQIVQVSFHTCRVLLLSDPSSQVGVMAANSRLMGILQGLRREQAAVEFFEPQPLKPGDLVVTSGLSSRFPPGLPVGRVAASDPSDQAVPRVKINFAAPIGRLEWVKIYPQPAPPPAAEMAPSGAAPAIPTGAPADAPVPQPPAR